jgi:hypothetical protein
VAREPDLRRGPGGQRLAKSRAVGFCGSSPAFLFVRIFATTPLLVWLLCPGAVALRRSCAGWLGCSCCEGPLA